VRAQSHAAAEPDSLLVSKDAFRMESTRQPLLNALRTSAWVTRLGPPQFGSFSLKQIMK